mgnify:CR=1 FL=1
MTKNILKAMLYGIALTLIIWAIISFFDVISNNLTSGKYWDYNFFIILSALRK